MVRVRAGEVILTGEGDGFVVDGCKCLQIFCSATRSILLLCRFSVPCVT